MEKFYFKSFIANSEKFTFVRSGKTPLKLHKNDVDLCNTNLTIPFDEMETAIKELQENGSYKNFIISEYITERNRKEAERIQKNIEYWGNIQKESKRKKEIMQNIITEIELYCQNKENYQLVYNKLENCIKDGYFVIYTYSGHKIIRLKEIGILEYNKRIS